jgi:hypothetical protein
MKYWKEKLFNLLFGLFIAVVISALDAVWIVLWGWWGLLISVLFSFGFAPWLFFFWAVNVGEKLFGEMKKE